MYIHIYTYKYTFIYLFLYIYKNSMHQGRIHDSRKGGSASVYILNRYLRRLSTSEAPKAPRGDVERGALLTQLKGLRACRELPQQGPERNPGSY